MHIVYTIQELPEIAKQLLTIGKDKKVWAFDAPMGAGKTTLIGQLCKELEIIDAISSPTFSIINEYKSLKGLSVCHMDWYRLKDEEEALRAGVEDALYEHNLSFVEWPEKAAQLLPENTFFIKIFIVNPTTRQITIKEQ